MVHIFISYSRVDRTFAEELARILNRVYAKGVWFDEEIHGGEEWWRIILGEIAKCDVFIYLLTPESIESSYCKAEFEEAQRLQKLVIPVRVRARTQIPSDIAPLQLIDMIQGISLDNMAELQAAINKYTSNPRFKPSPPTLPPTPKPDVPSEHDEIVRPPSRLPPRLCERISQQSWRTLEEAAVKAVTAGGTAAMFNYHQMLDWPTNLEAQSEYSKNPSTIADLQATAAILQSIHANLLPISNKLICSLIYLGEETKFMDWLRNHLSQNVHDNIHPADYFFAPRPNVLRVLLDGIDGTASFTKGMKLFCSALAILVDDQVRVSAIYDPIHHVVYSALLPGPYENPESHSQASIWELSSGNRIDLVERATKNRQKRSTLAKEAVGIHLTRTYPSERHKFLKVTPPYPDSDPEKAESMLERLADASGGIYSLGSGIVAMADVARGALGAFVNNYTNLWDIAAGEVLVRACGGKVTDFTGSKINYSSPEKVSVVASKDETIHTQILHLLNE